MSLKSDDIDNISQHSDDMDDDLDRPMSPQLPLSLTTHERHRFGANSAASVKATNNNEDSAGHTHNPPGLHIKSELVRSRSPSAQALLHQGHNNGSIDRIMNVSRSLMSDPNDPHTDNEDADRHSSSLKGSPQSEDLDMESDINPMDMASMDNNKRNLNFPMVPNSMFSHSIMYMSHYIPQMSGHGGGVGSVGGIGGGGGGGGGVGGVGVGQSHQPNMSPQSMSPAGLSMSSMSNDERRKRNRTFIDPVTEVPKLEQWFAMNTHPSHNLILKYTEDLNRMPYR